MSAGAVLFKRYKPMIKYAYTTLAAGKKYFDQAEKFAEKLYALDPRASFFIATDNNEYSTQIPNTIINLLPPNTTYFIHNYFNYNLKFYAIKFAKEFNVDYIIYVDADWIVSDHYHRDKIQLFFDNQNKTIDFFFERPHLIGQSKIDLDNCFWRHKIEPYNLMDTDKYDQASVCNEQFMIFKNNNKLDRFTESWQDKNEFCITNNVWTFAEGVEIGMSAVDADMNSEASFFREINNCFEFYDILGNLYTRF